MTSPRLQFTPMQILQMKMKDLKDQLLCAQTEDERNNIAQAMMQLENDMEREGDKFFDKALN